MQFADADECVSNPCQYGDCLDGVLGYVCNCNGTGYTGALCETGLMTLLVKPSVAYLKPNDDIYRTIINIES